ncbi:hypothetical protein FQR65_LT02283 [Abscondita terminalis]|nr:hypothetical protein FQR65_LT02283 [Abscondita terminalis]
MAQKYLTDDDLAAALEEVDDLNMSDEDVDCGDGPNFSLDNDEISSENESQTFTLSPRRAPPTLPSPMAATPPRATLSPVPLTAGPRATVNINDAFQNIVWTDPVGRQQNFAFTGIIDGLAANEMTQFCHAQYVLSHRFEEPRIWHVWTSKEKKFEVRVRKSRMIEEALESMVTHLVQCTCNGTINCPKTCNNEVVEHEDLALKQPISAICTSDAQNKRFMAWNSILKGLLTQCTQLSSFGREMITSPSPFALNWQQIHNRKVLAPLALKHNTDNIIAGNLDMKRKGISDLDNTSWTPPNKIPKLDLSTDNLKLCSVELKRTSVRNLLLQYRCLSKTPFVKLFDVLKEIPQEREDEKPVEQNEFMNFFGLQTCESINTRSIPEIKTGHPIKLTKTVGIPFSSIYGQTLLNRERHCLPQEAALKKIERTDWYLKSTRTNSNSDYSPLITYDKKPKYTRNYKFPKKQFHHKPRSLKREFLEYLCKPVHVKLELMDVSSILAKKNEQPARIPVETIVDEETVVVVPDDPITIPDDDEVILIDSLSDCETVQVDLTNDFSDYLDVIEWKGNSCQISETISVDSIAKKRNVRRSFRLTCGSIL